TKTTAGRRRRPEATCRFSPPRASPVDKDLVPPAAARSNTSLVNHRKRENATAAAHSTPRDCQAYRRCISHRPRYTGSAVNVPRSVSMRASALWTVILATQLAGCGYNKFQSQDEQVKAAWSEVVNQYQRRADLIPNLVETVKGFAQQERDVLLGVTEARSKVGSIQATP